MERENLNLNEPNSSHNDQFVLSNSNNPNMSLTTTNFNGPKVEYDYINVHMIEAKFNFIDGSCPTPLINALEFHKWMRCDYMVMCWLLNSLETNISEPSLLQDFGEKLMKSLDM